MIHTAARVMWYCRNIVACLAAYSTYSETDMTAVEKRSHSCGLIVALDSLGRHEVYWCGRPAGESQQLGRCTSILGQEDDGGCSGNDGGQSDY
jgi:hypothetical protein